MLIEVEPIPDDGASLCDDIAGILAVSVGTDDSGPHADLDLEGRALIVPAPNAIEWATGDRWCSSSSLFEFVRSYQTIRDFFELRCPLCNPGGVEDGEPGDCWGKSRMWLESETLLVWDTANREDTCPRCHTTRAELETDGLLKGYNQMHLVVGMRAGKSMTAALMATFFEHRYLTIAHGYQGGFHEYLDITKAEQFEGTFLAANAVQSKDTIWSKYMGFRTNSTWFKRYVPWLRQQEKLQPRTGMRLWRYEEASNKIINEHPNVRLVINSLNTNSGGQAGRTRVWGLVDELARMKQTEGTQGAQEIYRTIEASMRTVRSRVTALNGHRWLGAMVSVTSPIARDDVAMRLLRKSVDIPDMYSKHYPTWQFNPREPEEGFESNRMKDPIGWQRDFKADPAGAEFPLIHDEYSWRILTIDEDLKPNARFDYYDRYAATGQEYVAVRLRDAELTMDMNPRVIVFDAGKNFDAFAGACAHREVEVDDNGRERFITVFDWIIRILPTVGTEVYFDSVRDLVQSIQTRMLISRVQFDRWNSVQLIQQIRDMGIESEQHSIKDKDYVNFKIACYSQLVRMLPPDSKDFKMSDDGRYRWVEDPPFMSAESAAIYEMLGLEQDPDTNRVYNPNKGRERGWNCGRGDTPVALSDGSRKLLKDVEVGDQVLDRTGRVQRVERQWCEGTPSQLSELKVYGRPPLYFTKNHEWPVWAWARHCQCGCGADIKPGKLYASGHNGGRGSGQGGVVVWTSASGNKHCARLPDGYDPIQRLQTSEMRKDDFLLVPRKFDPVDTDVTEDKARLLGYYAAEGHLRDGKIWFAFGAHERDTWVADVTSILEKEGIPSTVKWVPSKKPEYTDDETRGGIVIWTRNLQGKVDTTPLQDWLRAHAGVGARAKQLSEEVMRWPVRLKRQFLIGLFRGDATQGWSTSGDGYARFGVVLGVVAETLVDQVVLLLAQCGFPTRRTITRYASAHQADMHYVKIPVPWAYDFAEMVWGRSVERKTSARPSRSSPMVDDDFVYLPIQRVQLVDNDEPVYNLTVSGDHSYLVGGVATWNSNDVAQVCVHAHKLIQELGYTEKQGDRSRRAAKRRAEGGAAQWGQRSGGGVARNQGAASVRNWSTKRGW